jgi:iron complex outermembrane receptor protein
VSSLKNGSGISKPVIHGLTGNRVAILNNGLVQAGQQWGADHAPEIDPFTADRITVIKGVETIAYGGNTLGGAVLVEPGSIAKDPHLHGATQYVLETNGWQHTLSSRLEKSGRFADWRVLGTFKQGGDHQTPTYFLRNTGVREQSLAAQVQKTIGESWYNTLYYSYFHLNIGILRGAHVGNLTDLETAIGRAEPFFTEADFSYRLEEPRQEVGHHLLKYNSKYFLTADQFLELTYGLQVNHRQEFDVRRGDRSDRPALDLQLFSHFVDFHWQDESGKVQKKIGIQFRNNENDNQPNTGVLPLLPDYESSVLGAYLIWNGEWHQLDWQLGGRFDYNMLDVAAISRDLPRRVEYFDHQFSQFSLAGGLEKSWHKNGYTKLNVGLAERAPEVNELYSNGLHQGVSGIEEGRADLQTERSLKVILTQVLEWKERFFLEASLYHQLIQDFIYLQPEEEVRLTIRGAFPVFTYQQDNATISGLDLTSKWVFAPQWEWQNRYALVRGQNRVLDEPLVAMPADNWMSTVSRSWEAWGGFSEPQIGLSGQYVWQQSRLLPSQDFLAPPPAYFLLNVNFSTEKNWNKGTLHLHLQLSNVLNTTYRDYLNRLRYYADEEGRNVKLNLRYEF